MQCSCNVIYVGSRLGEKSMLFVSWTIRFTAQYSTHLFKQPRDVNSYCCVNNNEQLPTGVIAYVTDVVTKYMCLLTNLPSYIRLCYCFYIYLKINFMKLKTGSFK